MNLPLFIAQRIASTTNENRPTVVLHIATIAVALSLMVMLLSISVIMGFKVELTRKLTGFAQDIELTDIRSINSMESFPITRNPNFENQLSELENISAIYPYATKGGVIKNSEGVLGVVLKGVDRNHNLQIIEEELIEGTMPRLKDSIRTKDILISKSAAERLKLSVGDKIEMLFIDDTSSPRRDRFKVCGIFSTGMEEIDQATTYTDIRNVQRILGWQSDQISGYEISTKDSNRVATTTDEINDMVLYSEESGVENLAAQSISERYPMVFDWLLTHDVNAAVILVIMLIVALFNMTSALLILVFERTRMIGILKAMGMNNSSLRRIFLYRASFIILKGLLWGNLLAIALCLAQKSLHIVKLDSSGYLLSEVPIAIDWSWWLGVNAGAAVVIILLLAIPASIVSYIEPERSIRYQ